nr:unnamed protein product [Trypanosoma congolense IL3000]
MVLSFPRHAYLGIVINEFSRMETICDPLTVNCRYPDGQSVIDFYQFDTWSVWKSIVSLLGYEAVLITITYLSLYAQGKRSRGQLVFKQNLECRGVPTLSTITPREEKCGQPSCGDRPKSVDNKI